MMRQQRYRNNLRGRVFSGAGVFAGWVVSALAVGPQPEAGPDAGPHAATPLAAVPGHAGSLGEGGPAECQLSALFEGLGDLPGDAEFHSAAAGISADGRVIVGTSRSINGPEAFRWEEGTMTGLGDPPGGGFSSGALAVSADGAVIVGLGRSDAGMQACRWDAGVPGLLGDLPGGADANSRATGVSADGSVVVGVAQSFLGAEGFRWENGQMAGLGDLPGGGLQSEAFGVSPGGTIVVGAGESANGSEAFRWTDGMFTPLGDLGGGPFDSAAFAIAADGTTIVGAGSVTADVQPVRWIADLAVSLDPQPVGAFIDSRATAVSADGSVIVGWGKEQPSTVGTRALIWDAHHGLRDLRVVLTDDFGLDLSGWHLSEATGVSADGRIVVGVGINPSGNTEAWRARLATSPDCNHNGVADACDVEQCGGDPACGDCNNNQVPDGCDLVGGLSQDADGNGIPDECNDWTGEQDELWSNQFNWEPPIVPDNNPDQTFAVTIGGAEAVVVLDINAEIDALRVLEGATLSVSMGDLDVVTAAGIHNDGRMVVENGHAVESAGRIVMTEGAGSPGAAGGVTPPQLHVGSGGVVLGAGADVFDAGMIEVGAIATVEFMGSFRLQQGAGYGAAVGLTGENTATLSAGAIEIISDGADGGAHVWLRDQMSATVDGVISLVTLESGNVEAQGGTTPPNMNLGGDSSMHAAGINARGSALINMTDQAQLNVGGGINFGVGTASDSHTVEMLGGSTPPTLRMDGTSSVSADTLNAMAGAQIGMGGQAEMSIAGEAFLDDGATIHPEPASTADHDSTLLVGSLTLTTDGDGARLFLDDEMAATVAGDFGLLGNESCSGSSLLGGCTPPTTVLLGRSGVDVGGNLILTGSVGVLVAGASSATGGEPNLPGEIRRAVIVRGDYDHRGHDSESFHFNAGVLALLGGSQRFEVAGEDRGATAAGFADNFVLSGLEVGGESHTTFNDQVDNVAGPEVEAQYVHLLILREGSKIVVDGVNLYYQLLVDEGAEITTLNGGALIACGFCSGEQACGDGDPCTSDACVLGSCAHEEAQPADVTGDGLVNAADVLCLLNRAAGLPDSPECETSASGSAEAMDIAPCAGHGPSPNAGDGVVNSEDVAAALEAFSGVQDPQCLCAPKR